MRTAKSVIALMLSVILIGACAGNKGRSDAKAARDAAERAIEAAVAAGAEQYSAEELTKARDLFADGEQAFTEGRYDDAASLFRQSREWADKARQIALERQRELGIKVEAAPLETTASCSITTDVDPVVIYFDFDKSNIRTGESGKLDAVAACLKKYPGTRLVLEGHADERGTTEYNMALGDRRANGAKRYLEVRGIGGLDTISYGEERPADPGHNEAAWAKNRRVELTVR